MRACRGPGALAARPAQPASRPRSGALGRTVPRPGGRILPPPPRAEPSSNGNGAGAPGTDSQNGASGNGAKRPSLADIRESGEEAAVYKRDKSSRSAAFSDASWVSLRSNACKAFGEELPEPADPKELGAEDARQMRASTAAKLLSKRGLGFWRAQWKRFTSICSYQYYNWRKDSSQDLLLFIGLNFMLLILGGLVKGAVIDALDGALGEDGLEHFWRDVYQVLVVVFGQELPDEAASVVDQVFALAVTLLGLGAFALVLALIEQVVLENLENNVRTGSKVFEENHILVLGWCENQRDEEVMWKILSQVCQGYRSDGGRTVVVLSQRPKVEMESTFRRIIPDERRFGSRFVFRQGSPLVPADLRRVAASAASAIIVVADTSRSPEEADAQSLRTAVLLDELDFPGFGVPDPRTAHILVELKTANAVKLMQYATSQRVIALPTSQLNARRIARMVRNPVVGSISQMLLSFNSPSQTYIEDFPQMEGKAFGDVFKWFPDGIVFGLVNQYSAEVKINPPPSTFVQAGDSLLIVRPNGLPGNRYSPAEAPVSVDAGNWSATDYVRASYDDSPMGHETEFNRAAAMTGAANWKGLRRKQSLEGGMKAGMFLLPLEYSHRSSSPEKVLICGWGERSFMTMLLHELDCGPASLPRGSELTLFNARPEVLGSLHSRLQLDSLSLLHVQGNPLDVEDMRAKLDIGKYKCVIVLCDQQWLDPDLDARNGILMAEESDMLRLDAMIMMVQLGIRQLLEESEFPEMNIITEKVAFEGVTRFEDRNRLPLGISVNMSAFSATFLAQVAYEPRMLLPYAHMGEGHELTVQDVSAFAFEGEELSFWQLQARVAAVGQVLHGTYAIPDDSDQPIDIVINPRGDELRSERRVWNDGRSMRKVITIAPKIRRDSLPDGQSILTSPSVQSASLLRSSVEAA